MNMKKTLARWTMAYFFSGIGVFIFIPLGIYSFSVWDIIKSLFLWPYTILATSQQGFSNITFVMMISALVFAMIGYSLVVFAEGLKK